MGSKPGSETYRHPDGYAGVISTEELRDYLRYALITCRHKDATRMHRCAHAAVHAMLCPCAWNEDCIVNAVKSELLCEERVVGHAESEGLKHALVSRVADATRGPGSRAERRQRNERLDQALDRALAETFPASDPVALSYGTV